MRYVALVYGSEDAWQALPESEREAVYARHRAFAEEHRAVVVGGAELRPVSTATTVRVRDGGTHVSDGPFAETKEQLGGFYLLECESLDEAVAVARRIPVGTGGAIEVRPRYVEAAP